MEWEKLWLIVDDLDDKQLRRVKKDREALIQWSPNDVLAHVYEWQCMTLSWCKGGREGKPDLPAKGHTWKTTRQLNVEIYNKHKKSEPKSTIRKLKLAHGRLGKLVESLSEEEFLESGHFLWTRNLPLSSYVAPNTVSHYRWAQKKIKHCLKK